MHANNEKQRNSYAIAIVNNPHINFIFGQCPYSKSHLESVFAVFVVIKYEYTLAFEQLEFNFFFCRKPASRVMRSVSKYRSKCLKKEAHNIRIPVPHFVLCENAKCVTLYHYDFFPMTACYAYDVCKFIYLWSNFVFLYIYMRNT